MAHHGDWFRVYQSGLISLKRILLTGFEPFHKASLNPTEEIVNQIEHPALIAKVVLPVVFGESSNLICALIDEYQPDVVVSLGQAEGRTDISIERVAINLDDARIPDNAGKTPINQPIIVGGPAAYLSTLPIRELVTTLNSSGIKASISNSAGTFVCNHLFYAMQHHLAEKEMQSGFIHTPLMPQQAAEFPNHPTMELTDMLRGIGAVLDYLAS